MLLYELRDRRIDRRRVAAPHNAKILVIHMTDTKSDTFEGIRNSHCLVSLTFTPFHSLVREFPCPSVSGSDCRRSDVGVYKDSHRCKVPPEIHKEGFGPRDGRPSLSHGPTHQITRL